MSTFAVIVAIIQGILKVLSWWNSKMAGLPAEKHRRILGELRAACEEYIKKCQQEGIEPVTLSAQDYIE